MGVLGKEYPILGNFAPTEAQNRTNRPPTWNSGSKVQGVKSYRNGVHINIARRVDVGSACVDIRPSPKTDVFLFVCTVTDLSGEDKASGVKFCMVVQGVLGRKSLILGNFAPP